MVTLQKENNQPNILRYIAFHYLPYWPLFVALIILFGAGAFTYLHLATPLYQSTAKLLIDDEKKGAQESEAIESLDKLSSNKIIENETEVIQSKELLSIVANRLALYAPVSEQKKFKSISAYTTSPVKVIVQDTDKIIPSKKIFFSVNKNNTAVTLDAKQYPINEWINTSYGVIKFIPNADRINTTDSGKFFFKLIPVKDVVNTLSSRLTVSTTTKESSILDLSLKDEDPVRSKNILNDLLLVYNFSIAKDKTTLAASTLNFIDNRLANVGHDLDSIESKVQQYKSQQNAIDVSTQGKLYMENVSNNDQKVADINMQLAALSQIQTYVQSRNASDGIVPSTSGINDPLLTQLLDKLYTAQANYDNLKKTTGENNPIVVSVKDEIGKLRPSILENIQSEKSSLLASREDLSTTNNSYSGVLNTIPQKEKQLLDINRQQGIKNNLYDFLLQKKEETSLSLLSNLSGSKIIDKADFDSSPVSPNKKLAYISSFLLAIIAGAGFVMSKETLGQKIMFRHDIELLTKDPVIAEISSGTKVNNALEFNTRTLVGQQFRNLRIALAYYNVNTPQLKRILVTSAISGEGKSFIAANLAITLAATGKKVALIDFDLHNPSLTNNLNIKEATGIADYFLKDADINDIIHQTDMHDNLYAVPAGHLSENASELLTNEYVEDLLNSLNDRFDYLIIDSAPVINVNDAYIISKYCDSTLYVVRHGYTPKLFMQQVSGDQKTNQLKNVGIVFNDVRTRGYKNKYYGYGYSYAYPSNKKTMSTKQIPFITTNK